MTAPIVLSYGTDDCQNWRTDALYYGTQYADNAWPGCKGGVKGSAGASTPPVTYTASLPADMMPGGPAARVVGGGGCGSCGCGGGGGGTVSGGVQATVAQIAAELEKPGPAGLPWWVWVLILLVILNLLRS